MFNTNLNKLRKFPQFLTMEQKELFEFLMSEADYPFTGWDFSYLGDRLIDFPLTWSYRSKILPTIRISNSLLDMGTGGGEFLSSLIPLPKNTCATEGYQPNVRLAKKRLEPLGVRVFQHEHDENLPFKNEEFDLIINRHESYASDEVYRILKPGGTFITQQVGDKNNLKLRLMLTNSEKLENATEWNMNFAVEELKTSNFQIVESHEDITFTRIFDVGAIVFYLKAIPWELPDFSVKKYHDKLVEIHKQIDNKGYLDLDRNNHRFLILAKKLKE